MLIIFEDLIVGDLRPDVQRVWHVLAICLRVILLFLKPHLDRNPAAVKESLSVK